MPCAAQANDTLVPDKLSDRAPYEDGVRLHASAAGTGNVRSAVVAPDVP